MKRKLMVFTGTRAEYGLLRGLMHEVGRSPILELQLLVSGSHLSTWHGLTRREIESDGWKIDASVEMLLASDTPVGVAKAMGLGVIGYADALDRLKPDILVLLGDRFEALAAAQTALIMGIPIAHLHGGELSEGAYDDAIRHAISKMASIHFAATPEYARRLMQMGEATGIVHCVGALGVENLRRSPTMSLDDFRATLPGGFPLGDSYLVVTYHPCTRSQEDGVAVLEAIETALQSRPSCQVIATYPNADNGGHQIVEQIKRWASRRPNQILALTSLGHERYIACMRYALAVVGNSSSGVIEAPSLGVPTVNIGSRQRGRLTAASVIHCDVTPQAIASALYKALTPEFRATAQKVENPYDQGSTAAKIVEVLSQASLGVAKTFQDWEQGK